MHRSVSGFEVVMIRWYPARWSASVIRSVVLVAVLAAIGCLPPRTAAAADDHFGIPQVKYINELIAAGWEDAGIRPSAAATDGEWCRRIHLDVIGRIPTSEELQGFLANTSPSKRPELVARLLGDDYVDEYARNWTDVWTTVLIGRDVANERVSRPGMRQYLRRAFSKNKPYDRFMEELVTATGATANRKDIDGFNGATNFLSGKLEEMGVENAVQATAKTAQIFLGLQVQCTQCHNHPFNKGKQNQFWEMNAFFRQTRALRRFDGSRDVQWVELIDEDWAGEGGNPEEAELYYELRNGLMKVAYPVFVDGTEISKSGYLPGTMEDGTPYGAHRRKELAKLIKASPYFPKAIVNRVWSHFLGYGFTKPVDDLGEHNPPSHPELLDGLAERFREQSFDLKELVRWIVLSRPYSLSSRAVAANAKDDPALGEKPKFSQFYLRQMQAEQLYESLLTATQADKTQRAEEAAKKKDQWLSQFVIAFGTDEGDDATTFNGSIPQVLMMFNGDLIKQATSTGKGGFLDAVATSGASAKAKIDTLYIAALSRKPSAKEVATANAILKARGGDVVGALQDIWWAVLNSNEFIINH
jgi:Tfp pilus assembly protein PilV